MHSTRGSNIFLHTFSTISYLHPKAFYILIHSIHLQEKKLYNRICIRVWCMYSFLELQVHKNLDFHSLGAIFCTGTCLPCMSCKQGLPISIATLKWLLKTDPDMIFSKKNLPFPLPKIPLCVLVIFSRVVTFLLVHSVSYICKGWKC